MYINLVSIDNNPDNFYSNLFLVMHLTRSCNFVVLLEAFDFESFELSGVHFDNTISKELHSMCLISGGVFEALLILLIATIF